MVEEITNMAHKGWRGRRKWIIIVFIVAIVIVGGLIVLRGRDGEEPLQKEKTLQKVEVRKFSEVVDGETISKTATIEPAVNAPLIARTGGRVTAVRVNLGKEVRAGQVVLAVDGGVEANPARVQLATASATLETFGGIEKQARATVDNAVTIAQLSLDAAKAGKSLSAATVQKSREMADNAVLSAEFALSDARDNGNDLLIRTADLALKAANLAQDQASLARDMANRQTADAVKQAGRGLAGAEITRDKLVADLSSQRIAIEGQVASASEQVRLAQVISPINGQVTRLQVRLGDYVRPGQQVGEVMAFEGAQVTVNVATGVRNKLELGAGVQIRGEGQEFSGEIVRLSDAPDSNTALWQVDILVAGTPEVVHAGDLVEVRLPVGTREEETIFMPLDAVTVRQEGVVLFTIEEGVVQEHEVNVLGFTGDFVEARIDLDDEALVVVSGNRTLRAGELVEVVEL